MFLIRELWGWILFLTLVSSPGARAAVGRITRDVWAAARYTVIVLWEDIGVPLLSWSGIVFVPVVLSSIIGIWWFPARVAAPVLLIIWFFLVRAGVNAIIHAIETATVAVLEPLIRAIKGLVTEETTPGATAPAALPEAEVKEARESLVEALRAGVRPLTWLVVCAALWGIQIIVFPHISGTTGLFVIFVVVALNLLGSLLGRVSKLPERAAQFFVVIAIIVFAVELPLRNTLPGAAALELLKHANRKSTAAVRKIAGGTWKGAVSGEHADGLMREFNRPFRSSLYEDFWKEKPRIFEADGREIVGQEYQKVVQDLESRPFVVVRDEGVPDVAKKAVGEAIDLAVIQASPSRPDDKYIVPSRCLDLESETRLSGASRGLQATVRTRQAEIQEKKLEDFKDTTKVPRFWRVSKSNASVWTLAGEKAGTLPINTLAYFRGETAKAGAMPDIPEKLIKIQLRGEPEKWFIVRALDGEEVANPFEPGGEATGASPRMPERVWFWSIKDHKYKHIKVFVEATATEEEFPVKAGDTVDNLCFGFYPCLRPIPAGTRINLVPETPGIGGLAWIFDQGGKVHDIFLFGNSCSPYQTKTAGWLMAAVEASQIATGQLWIRVEIIRD